MRITRCEAELRKQRRQIQRLEELLIEKDKLMKGYKPRKKK